MENLSKNPVVVDEKSKTLFESNREWVVAQAYHLSRFSGSLRDDILGEALAQLWTLVCSFSGNQENFAAEAKPVIEKSLKRYIAQEQLKQGRTRNLNPHLPCPGAEVKRKTAISKPELTTKQKQRLRRDIVIFAAHKQGCSQRLLAEVFDLPRSVIATVIQKMKDRTDSRTGTAVSASARPLGE